MISRALDAGVTSFIVPAYDAASLERTRALCAGPQTVLFPAYGIHPWYVDASMDVETLLGPYIGDPEKVSAIGEIGLDFTPGCPPPDLQVDLLRRQFVLAIERHLPVIIHCRKAHDQLFSLVSAHRGTLRGVMHSYSGSRELMSKFLDLGFFIGFSGSVTRRTAQKYHKNAAAVPFDRYLIETDAPSIATETTVASRVEPVHTVEVARAVAALRAISWEQVCSESTQNAFSLFRLPAFSA